MRAANRCVLILLLLFALPFMATTELSARPQTSVADQTLLNAANHDRAAAGLPPLHWDAALAATAHQHALRMAHANQLSHQFPGEPPLQDRARQAGARFSMIAENVAQGPTVTGLHTQWMNSAPHRANLLDPDLNAVGISVVQSGNTLFAVQDFATTVPSLSLEEQEKGSYAAIERARPARRDRLSDARKTCELITVGLARGRPRCFATKYRTCRISQTSCCKRRHRAGSTPLPWARANSAAPRSSPVSASPSCSSSASSPFFRLIASIRKLQLRFSPDRVHCRP